MVVKRFGLKDRSDAKRLFLLMSEVFGEDCAAKNNRYLDQLLAREDFWVVAAYSGEDIIGGVTAYTLPLTRQESSELFIYDLAVQADYRRQGVGRRLVEVLRSEAAKVDIHQLFVIAENADEHALDFYRGVGGDPTATTVFGFSRP